tara:strand:+ start:533 stop:697 length:165 start_codon:yes stop_codon:yes gene_type:complete
MSKRFEDATRDLVIAASSAIAAIEQGEASIGKLYLEAALSQMIETLEAEPEALA